MLRSPTAEPCWIKGKALLGCTRCQGCCLTHASPSGLQVSGGTRNSAAYGPTPAVGGSQPHFPKYTVVCCTLDSPPPAPNLSPSCSPPLCHAREPGRASLPSYSSREVLLLGLRAFLRAEQEVELRQAKTSPGDGLRIRPQEETRCASCSPPLLCTVSPSTKPLCFPPWGARL